MYLILHRKTPDGLDLRLQRFVGPGLLTVGPGIGVQNAEGAVFIPGDDNEVAHFREVPSICRGRRKFEKSCPQYERTGMDASMVDQLSRQWHSWVAKCGRDKR